MTSWIDRTERAYEARRQARIRVLAIIAKTAVAVAIVALLGLAFVGCGDNACCNDPGDVIVWYSPVADCATAGGVWYVGRVAGQVEPVCDFRTCDGTAAAAARDAWTARAASAGLRSQPAAPPRAAETDAGVTP